MKRTTRSSGIHRIRCIVHILIFSMIFASFQTAAVLVTVPFDLPDLLHQLHMAFQDLIVNVNGPVIHFHIQFVRRQAAEIDLGGQHDRIADMDVFQPGGRRRIVDAQFIEMVYQTAFFLHQLNRRDQFISL